MIGLKARPRRTRADFPLDELRNDVRSYMSQPKVAKEIPTWRPDASQQARQGAGIVIPAMNGVGGTSIHCGTAQWRFAP